ncbi:hypothetical protein CEP53_006034 [Fusarium sp. AF-6]|nr:hypothetical protein CEP53_006034 [Fusarium sp. AF-6]
MVHYVPIHLSRSSFWSARIVTVKTLYIQLEQQLNSGYYLWYKVPVLDAFRVVQTCTDNDVSGTEDRTSFISESSDGTSAVGLESSSVDMALTETQTDSRKLPFGSTTESLTDIMTTSLMSTTTNLNTAAFPTSSDGIVELPGRSVIFLVEIEESDNQKRDISKRATGGFVGQDNPDVCTFAATYNLAEGQLFTGGVPVYYSGEEFKELGGDGPPVSGSITRTFDTDGRTLVFRNPELPNGEAGFCQDSSGQVYLTFTAEPSNCVPVTLAVYDVAQCQDGRLVGFDTSTTLEIVSETSMSAEVSSRSASSEESMTAEATISTEDNSPSSSQTEPSGRSSEASTFEASTTTVSSEVIDSSASTPSTQSSILFIDPTTETLSSIESEVLGSTIDTSTGSDSQPSSEVTGFASFSTFSSSEQTTPNTSTTTSDSSSEMDESETQATTTESSREIDTTETEETTTESSSSEIDTTTVESSSEIYTSTTGFSSETEATTTESSSETEATTTQPSSEVDTSTTEATTTTSQETTSADTTTTDLAMTTTSEFSSDIDTSSTEATTTTDSETTTSTTTADTTTDVTSTTASESSSEIYTSTTEPSSETETTTAQSSSEIDTSTTEETTTTSLETSTADTTTDLTTTTSSPPEPDECTSLSDPYNVGGFDFDLSCNTAVTSFGNSIGQAQANSFSQCVLFCAESPSCGGVQYHKSNMLCDGYTLITGTTGNNLFHVAIKLYPTTTTSAEPTTSIEP